MVRYVTDRLTPSGTATTPALQPNRLVSSDPKLFKTLGGLALRAMQSIEHHGHGPIYACGSGKAFVRAGSRPANKQACSAVHRGPCDPGVRGTVGIARLASYMESHG